MRRRLLVVLSVLLLGSLAACASGGPGSTARPGAAPTSGATRSPASSASPAAPAATSSTASSTFPAAPTRAVASYAAWRLPFAISREAVVADPARPGWFLLAGGMLPGDASSARAIRLDPATGRTQPMPALATPVHDTAGGLFGGSPAVFGGGNATEQSVVQVLDGGAWRRAAQLPTTRSDLSVVSTAGSTLVIGGYDGTATPRDVLRVSGDGTMTPAGRLRQGVRYAATAVVGSHVYVFGGEVDHRELDAVQDVDATTGHTRIVARLPVPLGHAAAVTIGDRVLLLGGRTGPDTFTDAMWWFDPAKGSFERAGRLPAATSDAAVVASGNQAWLLGGESPSPSARATGGVTGRVIAVRVS